MRKSKTHRVGPPIRLLLMSIVLVALVGLSLTSCNVTRTTTTTASTYMRGDTCVQVMTKTVESYDATKKPAL